MKKLLLVLVAALLLTGTVYAAGIPTAVDPQNAPEIWTQEVFNNSGSTIYSGFVVVWDCASDSTDANFAYRTSWVTTTTTEDDIKTAGVVVDGAIADQSTGTICIYGPVYAKVSDSSDAVTQNQLVGTYSTAGSVGAFAATVDQASLGWSIYASPVSTAYGGYGGTDAKDGEMQPIFVNIVPTDG